MTFREIGDSIKQYFNNLGWEWQKIESGSQSLLDTDIGTLFVIFIIGCFFAFFLSQFVIGFLGLIVTFFMLLEGFALKLLEKLLPTKIMTILNKTFENVKNPRLLIYLSLIILWFVFSGLYFYFTTPNI